MKVRVQLFARPRDLVQRDAVEVELPTGATVADLRNRLAADHPVLANLLPRCAVAVDADFASNEHILTEGNEVALLPPVSGG